MDKFIVNSKLLTVNAYRLRNDKVFYLNDKTIIAKCGDWVVYPYGQEAGPIIVSNDLFQLIFDVKTDTDDMDRFIEQYLNI